MSALCRSWESELGAEAPRAGEATNMAEMAEATAEQGRHPHPQGDAGEEPDSALAKELQDTKR